MKAAASDCPSQSSTTMSGVSCRARSLTAAIPAQTPTALKSEDSASIFSKPACRTPDRAAINTFLALSAAGGTAPPLLDRAFANRNDDAVACSAPNDADVNRATDVLFVKVLPKLQQLLGRHSAKPQHNVADHQACPFRWPIRFHMDHQQSGLVG